MTQPEGRLVSTESDGFGRLCQRVANTFEFGVGVRADFTNRCQADDDDQRQHDGVFDGRRAIFGNQELFDTAEDVLHELPFLDSCHPETGFNLFADHFKTADPPPSWIPRPEKPHREVYPQVNLPDDEQTLVTGSSKPIP